MCELQHFGITHGWYFNNNRKLVDEMLGKHATWRHECFISNKKSSFTIYLWCNKAIEINILLYKYSENELHLIFEY